MTAAEQDSSPGSILSKAFDVLGAFGPQHRVLTLTEIARSSGLPKSTVHRLLGRLTALGVIEPHGAGFKVGLPMRRFASAMPIESLRQSALPHLGALHQWSRRHVHLGALRGSRVVFVERLMMPEHGLPSADPGTDLPAHATALGKVLLAHVTPEETEAALAGPLAALAPNTITDAADLVKELGEVRQNQVAVARGESHPDVTCVAAPILIRGRAVGAVSVSTGTKDAAVDRALKDAVRVAADRVARDNRKVLAAGHENWFPGTV
ncbi:IclR family transcriptional regulator [Amycolatopsis sp.]|uniref:IclR family transcriptional regulator n=1 Tax=Amycolatopsis sp. TaxID=37632 RepID=UPI002C393ABB|nr:IclR family transcriptional regulator [Amycolatopsis sp.]HVV07987.1 IclR family transcriptional regulator [Amycolatopsis sp.]